MVVSTTLAFRGSHRSATSVMTATSATVDSMMDAVHVPNMVPAARIGRAAKPIVAVAMVSALLRRSRAAELPSPNAATTAETMRRISASISEISPNPACAMAISETTTIGTVRTAPRMGQSRPSWAAKLATNVAAKKQTSAGVIPPVNTGAQSATPVRMSTAMACDRHETASATPAAAIPNAATRPIDVSSHS